MVDRLTGIDRKRLGIAVASAGALITSIVNPASAELRSEPLNPNQTVTKCSPGEFAFIEADATVTSNGETRTTWDGQGGYASAIAKAPVTVTALGRGSIACGSLEEVSFIGQDWKDANAAAGRRILNTVRVGFGEAPVVVTVSTPTVTGPDAVPTKPEVVGGVVSAGPTPVLVPEGCIIYGDVSDAITGRELYDTGPGSEKTASSVRINRPALIGRDFNFYVECIRGYGKTFFSVAPLYETFNRWLVNTVREGRIPLEPIDLNKGDGGDIVNPSAVETLFR